MTALLAEHATGVVCGAVSNQGRFYGRFEYVVLLSAPLDVLLDRVANRLNNLYGKTCQQQDDIARYVREVEPLLRRSATCELDGRRPVAELADTTERLLQAPCSAVRARVCRVIFRVRSPSWRVRSAPVEP